MTLPVEEHRVTAVPVEVVVVRLGGSRYTLPMDCVAEVGRPPALTRVPSLPSWLAGVANWRGRVLAIIDLRPLLGSPSAELDRRSRLVVLNREGVPVGLLTEGVEGTLMLEEESIEPSLANLSEGAQGLLAGQITDADGPCGVVDLEAVYRLADTLPRARRAG